MTFSSLLSKSPTTGHLSNSNIRSNDLSYRRSLVKGNSFLKSSLKNLKKFYNSLLKRLKLDTENGNSG